MKKIILFALLAISATMAMAQINPKSGIIITNSGDTIRGVIDFRTNEKLSKECEFWAEGKTEGKTYKPGDIEGFRFDDNGKYFVTRKLNVDGKPRLYFAEFMVKGMMNLYCVVENSDEHFFFEREDGEMAKLTSRAFRTTSTLQEVQDKMLEKKEQYRLLERQLSALLEGETDTVAKMANMAAVLHEAFGFWWTGFYRVAGEELILGPFQGPVACMHIPFGKGVCGTAWAREASVVVPDVEAFPGHIACSSASRSEIVVPVFGADGKVTAVLDIDSDRLATFDEEDRIGLERIVGLL